MHFQILRLSPDEWPEKYEKIILSFPPPAQLPGVRRTGFSPFMLSAYH